MQAITVSEFGGPEVLRVGEAAMPEPGPEEVLVRVLAAGVGPWDVSLRRGGRSGPLPYIPGAEFAGFVEGGAAAEAGFDDGAPVYGYPGLTGCYAQYVKCPVEQLAPLPAGLSVTEGAAVPVDALTAEQGLTDVLAVGAGDWVLITAGAGGLGHFAVQIARLLGATVVATARCLSICRPGTTGRTPPGRTARRSWGTPRASWCSSWTTTSPRSRRSEMPFAVQRPHPPRRSDPGADLARQRSTTAPA
jgi:NADPH:quinone reductase-like Zn-dependent oxidoreductase